MLKISDALQAIISNDAALNFSLHHKLLNLSQLSRFLRPLVEARVKKDVSASAILMALSRLQGGLPKAAKLRRERFYVQKIIVQSDLAILTFEKSRASHRAINELYIRVQKSEGYITVTEAVNEITVILEKDKVEAALKLIALKAKYQNSKVSSLTLKFDEFYISRPGFLYQILQQLSLQGINLLELASTSTELVLYLEHEAVNLAFDTLYNRFVKR